MRYTKDGCFFFALNEIMNLFRTIWFRNTDTEVLFSISLEFFLLGVLNEMLKMCQTLFDG